jgi:hypothetical protein
MERGGTTKIPSISKKTFLDYFFENLKNVSYSRKNFEFFHKKKLVVPQKDGKHLKSDISGQKTC